jgi:hypothetical protein
MPCDIGGYGTSTGVGGMAANLELLKFNIRNAGKIWILPTFLLS